jgi:hypothetical protein
MTSAYDRLHDQFWNASTPKSGTRYERLAAYVLKALNKPSTIIHDIKLVGESDVKHQIDVSITHGQEQKRVLVECKDFEVSSQKVSLGIIRDFASVVDDIKPDEAIVITCVGFTKDARKFAKHKGIKLAVLREFQASDWDGRIRQVRMDIKIVRTANLHLSLNMSEQRHLDKLQRDMMEQGLIGLTGLEPGQPVYLNLSTGRVQINDFVQQQTNEQSHKSGAVALDVPLSESTIEVGTRGGIPIQGIRLEFDVVHDDVQINVASEKIARLLFEGFDGKDIIIFEDDIKRLSIDEETGEVKG